MKTLRELTAFLTRASAEIDDNHDDSLPTHDVLDRFFQTDGQRSWEDESDYAAHANGDSDEAHDTDVSEYSVTRVREMLQSIPGSAPYIAPALSLSSRWTDHLLYEGGVPFDIGHSISLPEGDLAVAEEITKRFGYKAGASLKKVSTPPDISNGLGKRQEAMDTAALEAFVVSQAQWMIYEGCLCIYKAPCWHKFENENEAIKEIRQLLYRHGEIRESLMISDYRKIYSGLLSNPELEAPTRLDTPPYTINCVDGTLDLLTLQPHAHRPEDHFFCYFELSWRDVVNPPMRGEHFETFAAQIGNGNPAVRQQLLEMLAIAMTGTQLKHFFAMLGCSNSGKSQWGRFVQELLGRENVETVQSIGDFGARFTTGSLYGKLLVSCLDLPNGILPQTAVGVLKQFCGDDSVKGEMKYRKSFTYYKKPLVMLAGNHPIKVQHADREDALFNRMIVIPFADPGIDASQRIPNLYLRFLEEAPYIVREAAIAFQDLAARNWEPTKVPVPAEYAFQEGDHRVLAVKAFVSACVSSEPKAELSTADLFQAYDSFAFEYGYPKMDANFFSRKLSEVLKESLPEATPTKKVHGKEVRGYTNIALG